MTVGSNKWRPAPSRRNFLKTAAAFALGSALAGCAGWPRYAWRGGDPFRLGVASGAPSSDGFVLWTRLAPEPFAPEPTLPFNAVPVAYVIASDAEMRSIVRKGAGIAEPQFGHSVHVEVAGLEPGRPYWYRFMHGDATSRIGRAMTSPAANKPIDRLRFGFVSCSHYEQGFFSAYRHLADERPDLVIYLGDYIYEYIDQRPGKVRNHSDGVETTTLAHYRNRYSQYRLDPDLQRLHAEAPALVTWDDHEVQNDYANDWSQTFDDRETFLARRAAAYQAYYEFMPLRPSRSRPDCASMRIYDRFVFGPLAEISMLDGRQYRSREACYGPPNKGRAHLETNAGCPERMDTGRSLPGLAQEAWIFDGLAKSRRRWNILAQDVVMTQFRQKQEDGVFGFWTDDWNGYPASRRRLMRHIRDSRVANPVVLTGDVHSFWANDLKLDFDDPKSPVIASELVGTSITSYGPPHETFMKYMPDNPNIHFFDSRVHGYASVDLTWDRMTTRFQVVSDAKDPNATVSTLKTFVVENGKPGPQEA